MKYTVQAASRATGISSARLRTWERRYGIPSPERSETGRRLYSEEDLVLIRRMAVLVDAGVPAAQAAEAARAEAVAGEVASEVELPLEAHRLTLAISAASERYDEAAANDAIREAVRDLDWPGALEEILLPALVLVGERWERGDLPLSSEHFISAIIRRELLAEVSQLDQAPPEAPLVVVACPEDEQHDVGATALWLLLRRRGIRVVFLGADVPTPELLSTLRRTDADGVSLSATAPASLAMLGLATRALVAGRVRARIFVGGPALADDADGASIPGIRLPQPIGAAAEHLALALIQRSAE